MSLNTGSGKLAFALKVLRAKWDSTEMGWTDKVRHEFEDKFLQPIETEVMATLNAISGLSQVLAKAEQECRDETRL